MEFDVLLKLDHRTLAECSNLSGALTRHRIRHGNRNIPLIQRDLIEVYATSRLTVITRRADAIDLTVPHSINLLFT